MDIILEGGYCFRGRILSWRDDIILILEGGYYLRGMILILEGGYYLYLRGRILF